MVARMTHQTDTRALNLRLAELLLATGEQRVADAARANQLDAEIREAESWSMRRAARHERDRACYRLGSAFEPGEALDLDDVALCGLDHLGIHGLMMLAEMGIRHPGLSLSGLLRKLFEGESGPMVRAWGVWRRWHWLADFYHAETDTFLASRKGRDPRQLWRRGKVSVNQEHLIREISRYIQLVPPVFPDRGAAFDWIRDAGGNPRFRDVPPRPPLPALGSR